MASAHSSFSPPLHPSEALPSDQTNIDISIIEILHRRVHSSNRNFPLIIHEANVNKEHPAGLTQRHRPMVTRDGRREWYFFSKLELTGRAKRTKRINLWGAWHDQGKCQTITNAGGTKIGYCYHFTHYNADGERTGWIMKEFRIEGANEENLVLCKVYAKRQGAARAAAEEAPAQSQAEVQAVTQSLAEMTLMAREKAARLREMAVDARETAVEYREAVAANKREVVAAASQAEVERQLAAREAEFERRLAAREAEFERRLVAREAEFERRLADREAEFERRLAAREASVTAAAAGSAGAGNSPDAVPPWLNPPMLAWDGPIFSPPSVYYPGAAYCDVTLENDETDPSCIVM